ncbi:MAG: preprotein translocase subunit SecA [Bacteroidaceae bacterium]|nr:preprotein translocase subunit SecA [Bacteroidaceae bacterium]
MDISKFLVKIFGDKKSRDLKAYRPLVEAVLQIYPEIQALSNDELRDRTQKIRQRIQDSAADLREQIQALKDKIPGTDIQDRAPIFSQIDKLEKEVLEILEKALDKERAEVFAIVKSTAERFTKNETIEVTANDFDRNLAASHDFVDIEGDKAIYHNHWVAGGNDLKWEMIHFDVQLFGGTVLHQGKIAEMFTGEGKTLTATLPVFLNALTGNGVHVVTVNDYLAKRDSEWMGPIYMFHGLSVDCIDKHQPNSEARRKAYLADITFGTNNEFGFDYLRDNMAQDPKDLVQRPHNYAIVDEVDSVLIDDARTPLIISGPVPKGDDQQYEQYQPLVERLVGVQRQLATQYLADAKKQITEGTEGNDKQKTSEGFLALFRSHKALPKNKPLIKFLSEPGIKAGMLSTEEIYMENNNRRMPEATEPLYFVVDEKMNSVDLTDKGNEWLASQVNDPELFVLPDITTVLSQIDASDKTEEEKIEEKDRIFNEYATKSERVHTIQQLLKAYTMFNLNDEYVIQDGEIKIVDEQTGRIMEGRRWSDGLHQAVEAKEHVKVQAATQTYATITLQNYFRMYHKLSGMTGTAVTEAGEFWDIYKLDVVEVPTNREVIRKDMNDRVYRTQREKYKAVIEEVELMRTSGRPVLVGTTSVEISEMLSKMLQMRKIPHQVLNAKLHQKEADIVALAGQSIMGNVYVATDGRAFNEKSTAINYQTRLEAEAAKKEKREPREASELIQTDERMLGTVTIATNMAGRGTDIKLSPEVKAAGGLAIIGTERHESRRVDRQLRGRSGRQGDPGSSIFYVSIEDKLMRLFASERIAKVMDSLGFKEGEMIEHSMITRSIENAQKKVEENHFGVRKNLLEYDDVMNKQRTVIYEKRRHALIGERLGMDISNMIWDRVCNILENNDYEGCKLRFLEIMAMEVPFTAEQMESMKLDDVAELAYQKVLERFRQKTEIMMNNAHKVVTHIYEGPQGAMYENLMVPVLAGNRQYNIPSNLKEAYESQSRSVVTAFHKAIILHIIDDAWKENLRLLDELKHSVHNASYEQKDPLLIFKLESAKIFDDMINQINDRTVSVIMRAMIPELQIQDNAPQQEMPRRDQPRLQESRGELNDAGQQQAAARDTRERQPMQPIRRDNLPGRNDPCPCGSGKKFKQCHGRNL